MAYRRSSIDTKNFSWFEKDTSKATLLRMEMRYGSVRGLQNVKLRFQYPITAIAGRNGSGKSTLLGCVACAFHNEEYGYNPLNRKNSYYTFSDFLVQSPGDQSVAGIAIAYQILHDDWRRTERLPDGIGAAWQKREKGLFSGRWNKYQSRVDRNVVFLGIDRVVPHVEKTVYRTYRKKFQPLPPKKNEQAVSDSVGRVLGRNYEEFGFRGYKHYRLPYVKWNGRTYSGFNMGAGENALFTIFSIIHGCTESLMLVIDEIELGLHEEAQTRMVRELKELCASRHIQIVCSTHSPRMFELLPPEARIYLEKVGNEIRVIDGISPAYAAGLLSGRKNAEMDIFVEDDVSRRILECAFANDTRRRANVLPIGSASAVVQQMAARFKERTANARDACAILDGDQATKKSHHVKAFKDALENSIQVGEASDWFEERLFFLPGNVRPEKWILAAGKDGAFSHLPEEFGTNASEFEDFIQSANRAKPHEEFADIARNLSLDAELVVSRLTQSAVRLKKVEFTHLETRILGLMRP